jgi:hypothetical protein
LYRYGVATATHGAVSLVRISWEISAVALGMVPPGVALFGTLVGLCTLNQVDP